MSAWLLIAIVAAIRMALGLGKAPNDALVFPDIEGRPQAPSDVSRTWGLTAGGMGMPEITFHSLRHCHASQLIAPQLCLLGRSATRGQALRIHEIKHDGYRSQVLVERGEARVSPGMDLIGATVIHLSSVPLPTSAANRQSLMARPLSRTATALLTSRH